MKEHQATSARGLALALLALVLLAGLSLGLRFAHMGALGLPVALSIAGLKALLVVVFFMELLTERASVRFAFVAGVTLLGLLVVLVVADIVTRGAPSHYPPGTAERYRG